MIKSENTKIELNRGQRAMLVKEFGSSYKSVREAITYVRSTPLHIAIRQRAIEMMKDFYKQHNITINN